MLKTRLVGTEAVEVTDGQLDPKTGEGGERPDKIQPITDQRPKDRELIPFTFHSLYTRCFLKPTQGSTCFKKGFADKRNI